MLDRVLPSGLVWPSTAAEIFRVLSLQGEAVPRGDALFKRQYKQAQRELGEALGAELIKAAFLVDYDGSQRPLPGRFWYSAQYERVWNREHSTMASEPFLVDFC